MRMRLLAMVGALVFLGAVDPSASNAAGGKLVRVEFTGVIRTTTNDPFGEPYAHWKGKPVKGYFLYDPATRNALTPEQVEKKRTKRNAGTRSKRTLKEETTHIYLQNLPRSGFELELPGHKIVGSRRPLIHIKYRELDTKNSQFLFKDGKGAYVEYKRRQQHGRLMVDGESVKDAQVTLHFFDRGERLKSADLPEKFPFVLGKDLRLGASVDVGGRAILFEVTKLSWKPESR